MSVCQGELTALDASLHYVSGVCVTLLSVMFAPLI